MMYASIKPLSRTYLSHCHIYEHFYGICHYSKELLAHDYKGIASEALFGCIQKAKEELERERKKAGRRALMKGVTKFP